MADEIKRHRRAGNIGDDGVAQTERQLAGDRPDGCPDGARNGREQPAREADQLCGMASLQHFHPFAHESKQLQRIANVQRNGHGKKRDTIAKLLLGVTVAPHIHRDHDSRRASLYAHAAQLGVTPDGGGHERENHVVHRPAAVLTDGLDLRHRNLRPAKLLRPAADHVEGKPIGGRGEFGHYFHQVANLPALVRQLLCDVERLGLQPERAFDRGDVRLQQAVEKLSALIAYRRSRQWRLLPSKRLRHGAWIHQNIHDGQASHSIGQAMMDADNHAGAIAFQSAHQRKVPQGPRTIEVSAQDLRSHGLQFALRPMPQTHLADVIANVEIRIELPARQADIEWRKGNVLPVARNQGELGLDKVAARFERDRALEYADARNAQRLTGALEVQKQGISPGERIVWLRLRHDDSLLKWAKAALRIPMMP